MTKKEKLQESKTFFKVPNDIIKYSSEKNNLVLPIYLYSALYRNWFGTVNATITGIIDSFEIKAVNRRYSKDKKYTQTFLNMFNPVIENGERLLENSFSDLSTIERHVDNFTTNTPITYHMCDNGDNITSNFTKMEMGEIRYLCAVVKLLRETGKLNSSLFINLYVYLKMSIGQIESGYIADIRVLSLANYFNASTTTITKYINMMIKVGLIEENFNNMKYQPRLKISDKWRKAKLKNNSPEDFHNILLEKMGLIEKEENKEKESKDE